MSAEDYPHAWAPDNHAVIFESNRNGHWRLFRQKIDEQEPEPLVLSDADNVLAQASPDGKWVLYREDRERTKRRLMRVPMNGGTPEPVPGTENVVDFRCGQQRGSRCVLRSTENAQFVFYELDPLRGRGRELARKVVWSPTGVGDWDISPDSRFAALPNHDPQTAIIRVISLDAT